MPDLLPAVACSCSACFVVRRQSRLRELVLQGGPASVPLPDLADMEAERSKRTTSSCCT